jgi:glycosyl transferase, family 25
MNNPFDFFDEIYCINLAHRTDRWEECKENFKKLGIDGRVKRFEAKDHKDNPIVNPRDRGKLGCTHSHIEIIRQANVNKLKNVLIFEDDFHVHINPNVVIDKLKSCIEEIPENWDLFYLSGNPLNHPESVKNFSDNLCVVKLTFALHAFAANQLSYEQILQGAETSDDVEKLAHAIVTSHHVSVDGYYMHRILPNEKSYMCKSLLFTQRNSFSNIDYDNRDINNLIIVMYKNHNILEV